MNLLFTFASAVSCLFFVSCNGRRTLLNSLVNIDLTLLDNTDFSLTQILLFGNTTFNAKEKTKIINLSTDFVFSTKRFDEPLLWIVFFFLFSPRTLGISTAIYWLVAIRYYHNEFFFWCHESPGSSSVKFCGRFFYFKKNF